MSVRKRVIKILKDICVLQPDFPFISDICVRMIRRIGDEDGIKVWLVCLSSLSTYLKCSKGVVYIVHFVSKRHSTSKMIHSAVYPTVREDLQRREISRINARCYSQVCSPATTTISDL